VRQPWRFDLDQAPGLPFSCAKRGRSNVVASRGGQFYDGCEGLATMPGERSREIQGRGNTCSRETIIAFMAEAAA
jgi:hypothetical protein